MCCPEACRAPLPLFKALPPPFNSPFTSAGAAARVPVLFVPGHLGSHEQMRSMASETGRELVRRAAAAAAAGAPGGAAATPWLDWHGAEFRAEPSALEGHLLVRVVLS